MAKNVKKNVVDGKPRHYVVGFIIKRGEKYLLMERKNFPYGFASSAGHIDEGENVMMALNRELKEETELEIVKSEEVFNEIISLNPCRYDGTYDHMTYIYTVETKGELKVDESEFKSFGWYSKDEIFKLNLEPMWQVIFCKLLK